MIILLILGISLVLQYASAYIAYTISKSSGHKAWNLIAFAILLMAVRRSTVFVEIINQDTINILVHRIEILALIISAIMFIGLYKINPYLKALFRSEKELKSTNVELSNEIESHRHTESILLQFKTTLDQTLDSVFMFRKDNLKFFYVNQGALNMMGYTKDELTNLTPINISREYTEKSFNKLLQPLIDGSNKSIKFRSSYIEKSGKNIPVEIFLQLVESSGKNSRFVAIVRNIKNQVKIETELKSINEDLETFIYKASHDLRGPIATTKGLLNLITNTKKINEYQELIDHLILSNENLNRILDDLMLLTSLKRKTLEISSINLNKLLSKIIVDSSEFDGYENVNIQTNIQEDINCSTDKFALEIIIKNLLKNSICYRNKSIDHSFLKIEIIEQNEGISIQVQDNGNGISKGELAKVFNLFHRSSIDSVGSGMGLFIVKLAVSKLAGSISLSSEENKGSNFEIWIPELRIA